MIGCTCLNCGWVHMGLTRADAQQEVDSFNVWFDEQPPAVQDNYGRRSRIDTYEGCFRCGKTEFREAKDDDCPRGCTIQPVIWDSAENRQATTCDQSDKTQVTAQGGPES